MNEKLSDSHVKILTTLENQNALTYEELAKLTGLSYDGVRGRVSELGKKGFIINKIKEDGSTRLTYNKTTVKTNNPVVKETVSKLKSIEDFYGIMNFLDKVKALKGSKIKKLKHKSKKNPILVISDLHIGAIITDPMNGNKLFDIDIAKTRIQNLTQKVITQLKSNGLKHLYILMVGDIVDGDMIYRNHMFRVQKPAIEQVQDAVKILSEMFKTFESQGITIEAHCVRGNHGISNYNNLEEDNWDNVVYNMLDLVFTDNKNISVINYPFNEAKLTIEDKNIVLFHGNKFGDQIKTSTGLRNFRGMCGKHKLNDGDLIVVGHYHEFGIEVDQGKYLIRNGSLPDASEYAFKLNLYSEPVQTLMIVNSGDVYPIFIPMEAK